MVADATGTARRRSPFGAAAVAALVLTVSACAGSEGGDATVVTTAERPDATVAAAPATTAVTPSTSAAPAATAAPTTVAPAGPVVDAAAVLAQAVATLRAGYDVDTNVTAGDRSTNVAGRVVGVNSLFTLTSGGAAVEYLQVPPQVWVREPGTEWNEANSEAAPRDSLGPLAAPTTVTFVRGGEDGQHLRLSYAGAALGSETPTVDADVVIEARGGMTFTYAAVTQGKPVTVVTRLAPTADATPITAPV